MKHDKKVLAERLARIASFQQRGGKMGSVSPALAQWLLGVCRQRIQQLLSSGRLDSFGEGGFRLVPLRNVPNLPKHHANETQESPVKASQQSARKNPRRVFCKPLKDSRVAHSHTGNLSIFLNPVNLCA